MGKPQTSSMAVRDTTPWRKMAGESPETSMMVDGRAPGHGPRSIIKSTLASNWDATSSAVMGLGPPPRLALVPVMGAPRRAQSSRGTGWSGTRTATVLPQPLARLGMSGRHLTTRVRAPGQKAAARAWANPSVWSDTRVRSSGEERRRGTGLESGPALGVVEASDSGFNERVGAEAVEGVGGEGDEAATLKNRDCLSDVRCAGG